MQDERIKGYKFLHYFFLSSKNCREPNRFNEDLYYIFILYRRKMEELKDTNFCIISSLLPKIVA